MKFRTCPECGAALDFGEKCDCRARSEQNAKAWEQITRTEKGGQIVLMPSELTKEQTNNERS